MPGVHLSDHRGVSTGCSSRRSGQCACHPHGGIWWLLPGFPDRLFPGDLSRRRWWGEECAEQSCQQFQQHREWHQRWEAQCPEAHTQRHHHNLQCGVRIHTVKRMSGYWAHIPSTVQFSPESCVKFICLLICFERWHWHSSSSGPQGGVKHSKWQGHCGLSFSLYI